MPHLKKLTVADLAVRLNADGPLKRRLVKALLPLMPDASEETEARVLEALEQALSAEVSKVRAAYHVTCARCALNHVYEALDTRTAGLRVKCCVCKHAVTIRVPEQSIVVACAQCGTETTIQRIGSKV